MNFNWNLKPEESVLRFDPKNTLILLALEAGLSREMISSWNVVYTGVGKVNATLKGSEYVASYKPYLYLNPCRWFVYKLFIASLTSKSAVTSIGRD